MRCWTFFAFDFSVTAGEQDNNTTNASNNPVTPKTQVLPQNYFMPSPQRYDGRPPDQELLRLYVPVVVFGVQNIVRSYQPVVTNPFFPNRRDAGLGDTTVFTLALHKVKRFTLGAGPLLVLPVASYRDMGSGKRQAGAAATVVTERSWGFMGTVITYSHSFSGYGSRLAAGLVSVQPVSTLRSGIVMNVDVEPSIRCTTVVRDRRDGRSCPPSLFSFPLVPKRNTPRHRGQTVSTEAAWLKFLALAESERKATVSLLQVILETVC